MIRFSILQSPPHCHEKFVGGLHLSSAIIEHLVSGQLRRAMLQLLTSFIQATSAPDSFPSFWRK